MWALSFLGLDSMERPRLSPTTIRRLAVVNIIGRWPGLLFAAILSLMVPPRVPLGLALILVWVAAYNAWAMVNIPRADDGSVLRMGRALTLLDTISYFAVLFVFGGVGASTSIYAAYILLIVWLVAYDGAEGAMLAVAIFVLGMIVLHAALLAFFAVPFNARDVLLWSLIMVVAGAILAAYDRIVVGVAASRVVSPDGTGTATVTEVSTSSAAPAAVRLSRREQEVLRLVADGYSNTMIAGHLHLSENTVKTYVENLLSRLNARNRAEAVATASRQHLI
jgi:DNA-binding CsgD family transcriptional regulator